MEKQPYSIYVDHRPSRIAFLIDPSNPKNWIEQIIKYNRCKWGGRFNPIIFTDGKTIQQNWWDFLRKYDPDFVISTVELEEELHKNIQIFLAPLQIEILKLEEKYIHLSVEPISIRPSNKNISKLRKSIFNDEVVFVIFEVNKATPDVLRKFLETNFGIFENYEMNLHYSKDLKKKIYTINDFQSLNSALSDLAQLSSVAVFPSQLCSTPNLKKDIEFSNDNSIFQVIVGDGIEESVHFWNRTFALSDWIRTKFSHIWMSEELISNSEIEKGLCKFISRYSEIIGNNNNVVNFTTFSLSEEKIRAIATSFNEKIYHPTISTKYDFPQLPNFRKDSSFFFLKQGFELYRAHSEEEHLVLSEPDIEEFQISGEQWFIDLYIQYRPEQFKNKELWWQLPKRSLSLYPFFNKPFRINEERFFSVLMSRRLEINRDGNILILKLPRQDDSIFSQLICDDSFSCISKDPKERALSRPYDFFLRSDKGAYLTGVLSLFPNLLDVYHLTQERYWRRIFSKMSNQDPKSDEKNKLIVFDLLKKHIGRGRNFQNTDEINWLTDRVFNLAKRYSKKDVSFPFSEFINEAKIEHDDYNKGSQSNQIQFNEEYEKFLADEVTSLIHKNVLLIGIESKCPRCGDTFWYHVDEIKQQFSCKGCGRSRSLSSKETWNYKLNSLVKVAFSEHGVIPVLITLGQLLSDARSSFIYIPNIELYKNDILDDKKPIREGELDIVCIVDGKFVIGEVKQSIGLFKESDFIKMNKIAQLIKPDRIIFSSLDKKASNFVNDEINNLQRNLLSLEIDVEWYQIHDYVFEPNPVL